MQQWKPGEVGPEFVHDQAIARELALIQSDQMDAITQAEECGDVARADRMKRLLPAILDGAEIALAIPPAEKAYKKTDIDPFELFIRLLPSERERTRLRYGDQKYIDPHEPLMAASDVEKMIGAGNWDLLAVAVPAVYARVKNPHDFALYIFRKAAPETMDEVAASEEPVSLADIDSESAPLSWAHRLVLGNEIRILNTEGVRRARMLNLLPEATGLQKNGESSEYENIYADLRHGWMTVKETDPCDLGPDGTQVIGRDPAALFSNTLDDEGISRKHFTIKQAVSKNIVLTDTSTNGTVVFTAR